MSNGSEYTTSLIRGVLELEDAEDYKKADAALRGVLSDLTWMAREKFAKLAEKTVSEVYPSLSDDRVRAQGGE